MPSRKRQVLDCFPKRTLVDISRHFDTQGLSAFQKDEIETQLSRNRSINFTDILGHLKVHDLKRICGAISVKPCGNSNSFKRRKSLTGYRMIDRYQWGVNVSF